MYALCVSGAVNTQGFVWNFMYALYINFHSFIQESALKADSVRKIPCRTGTQIGVNIAPGFLVGHSTTELSTPLYI